MTYAIGLAAGTGIAFKVRYVCEPALSAVVSAVLAPLDIDVNLRADAPPIVGGGQVIGEIDYESLEIAACRAAPDPKRRIEA